VKAPKSCQIPVASVTHRIGSCRFPCDGSTQRVTPKRLLIGLEPRLAFVPAITRLSIYCDAPDRNVVEPLNPLGREGNLRFGLAWVRMTLPCPASFNSPAQILRSRLAFKSALNGRIGH